MPSGVTPTFVYAIVNFADSPATTRSNALVNDSPAPPAAPRTPATNGLGIWFIFEIAACRSTIRSAATAGRPSPASWNVLRSPPPQKILPSAVTETARTASSNSIAIITARRSRANAGPTALADSGRAKRTCATPSRTS